MIILYGSHGVVCFLDTSRELVIPGSVSKVKVSDDLKPKARNDPGFITDEVSKLHHLVFQESVCCVCVVTVNKPFHIKPSRVINVLHKNNNKRSCKVYNQ